MKLIVITIINGLKMKNIYNNFTYHIFKTAGHSWDRRTCKVEKFDIKVTKESFSKINNLFNKNK